MSDLLDRVKLRLPEEKDEALLKEFITTISDRLCLRLGVETLPFIFFSVAVDAAVKMYRRVYYEGIASENVTSISSSFVDDILAEYDTEIREYKDRQANTGEGARLVKFL